MAQRNLKNLKESYGDIIHSVTQAGGRFLFVGGCVRDAVLGVTIKDYDAEVYGLFPEKLEEILKESGPISFAGQSFGVYHLHHRDLEISIPRTDQKIGTGHRGFKVFGDPFLTFTQAARRRDLTMNSMGYDPLTNELLDPWNGQQDIKDKVLRATDPKVFGEDPLRALRVMQFSARFLMKPDKDLITLCRHQDLSELPGERILQEFRKLLVKGQKPSWGLAFLKEANLLRYSKGLADIKIQAWQDMLKKLDLAVSYQMGHPAKFGFMLTVIAYYLPSKGAVKSFLRSIKISNNKYKTVIQGYDALCELQSLQGAYDWRYWAYKIHNGYGCFNQIQNLIRLLLQKESHQKFQMAVKKYDLGDAAKMLPLVQGQDLIDRGLTPDKTFTDILKKCHQYQLFEGCFDKTKILDCCDHHSGT